MSHRLTLPEQSDRETSIATVWLSKVAIILVIAFAILIYLIVVPAVSKPRPSVEVNLLDPHAATMTSYTAPAEAEVALHVQEKTFIIGNEGHQVLFMHPPASASFWLKIPKGARLEFMMGIAPEVWDKPGDGVDFQVRTRQWSPSSGRDEERVIFSRYLDPKSDPSARRWVDAAVDLSPLSGQHASLIFHTISHDSSEYDWAGWGRPRIASWPSGSLIPVDSSRY